MSDDVEHGFCLCQKGKQITRGLKVSGGSHHVDIPLRCPPGSKVVGVSHYHPGGSSSLSEQDKQTAQDKHLSYVCITRREGKAKCYKFNHGKK